jgi:hypothetical protein
MRTEFKIGFILSLILGIGLVLAQPIRVTVTTPDGRTYTGDLVQTTGPIAVPTTGPTTGPVARRSVPLGFVGEIDFDRRSQTFDAMDAVGAAWLGVWWTDGSQQNREFFREGLRRGKSFVVTIARARSANSPAQTEAGAAKRADEFCGYMWEFAAASKAGRIIVVVGNEPDLADAQSGVYFAGDMNSFARMTDVWTDRLKRDGWTTAIAATSGADNGDYARDLLTRINLARIDFLNRHPYQTTAIDHHRLLDRYLSDSAQTGKPIIVSEFSIHPWGISADEAVRRTQMRDALAAYAGKDRVKLVMYYPFRLPLAPGPAAGAAPFARDFTAREPWRTFVGGLK